MGALTPEQEKGNILANPPLDYVTEVTHNNHREPTKEERVTLRCVKGPMSWVSLLVCLVEFAERASACTVDLLSIHSALS